MWRDYLISNTTRHFFENPNPSLHSILVYFSKIHRDPEASRRRPTRKWKNKIRKISRDVRANYWSLQLTALVLSEEEAKLVKHLRDQRNRKRTSIEQVARDMRNASAPWAVGAHLKRKSHWKWHRTNSRHLNISSLVRFGFWCMTTLP